MEYAHKLFKKEKVPSLLFSIRLLTSVVIFFGYCFQNMLRISLNIGIVCMVNHTAIAEKTSTNLFKNRSERFGHIQNTCKATILNDKPQTNGPFIWSKSIQGMLISSYFYGYILTQLFGGWLSYKFGGRRVLGISMALASLITITLPFCAQINYVYVVLNRLILGAFHGVFSPTVSSIWSCWAPPDERGTLTGIANAGSWFGSVLALTLGAHLCTYDIIGGWKSIYFIYGFFSFIWCLVFFNLTTDRPEQHSWISIKEKTYISNAIIRTSRPFRQSTPWIQLLTCKASISIFVAHFCSNWNVTLFLNKYIKDVLKFKVESNGLTSAIPFVFGCFLAILSSLLSDKLIQKGKMKKTDVRKLFGAIGFFIPVLALVGLAFVTCEHPIMGIFLLVITIGFNSTCSSAGHLVNINDISGPFSGILFGVSNTIAALPGIICPYITGILTADQTVEEWQLVIGLCGLIYFIGGCVYVCTCDANLQSWALNLEKRRHNIFQR